MLQNVVIEAAIFNKLVNLRDIMHQAAYHTGKPQQHFNWYHSAGNVGCSSFSLRFLKKQEYKFAL